MGGYRLICAFVVRIWHKQVFSRRGSYVYLMKWQEWWWWHRHYFWFVNFHCWKSWCRAKHILYKLQAWTKNTRTMYCYLLFASTQYGKILQLFIKAIQILIDNGQTCWRQVTNGLRWLESSIIHNVAFLTLWMSKYLNDWSALNTFTTCSGKSACLSSTISPADDRSGLLALRWLDIAVLEEEPDDVEDFRDNWKMFSSERFNEVSLKHEIWTKLTEEI